MPKTKGQKQAILKKLEDSVKRAKSIIFTNFDALQVKENEELRQKLRAENGEYYVAKKTLLDIALRDSKVEGLDIKKLDGKTAIVFSYDDEVAAARVIDKFREGREEKINFVGGILENNLLSKEEVEYLAKLPSKQELYAKIVGSINAPVSGFVNVLAGNIRGFVNVLKAIEEKK